MIQWRTEPSCFRGFIAGATAAGLRSPTLVEIINRIGTGASYSRDSEIFAEGDRADHIYKVESGAVRLTKLTCDGRRLIGAFYLPGDIFGLEAEDLHDFSAEAVGETKLISMRCSTLMAEVEDDREVARQLWKHTLDHLRQARIHMLLLGRKNAHERIAAFLLEMEERAAGDGCVELPMCRQDIADYLGLTIETVSRTMTHLERSGVIGLPTSRRVVLRDHFALEGLMEALAA